MAAKNMIGVGVAVGLYAAVAVGRDVASALGVALGFGPLGRGCGAALAG
jgi:hypothetical protein